MFGIVRTWFFYVVIGDVCVRVFRFLCFGMVCDYWVVVIKIYTIWVAVSKGLLVEYEYELNISCIQTPM